MSKNPKKPVVFDDSSAIWQAIDTALVPWNLADDEILWEIMRLEMKVVFGPKPYKVVLSLMAKSKIHGFTWVCNNESKWHLSRGGLSLNAVQIKALAQKLVEVGIRGYRENQSRRRAIPR